MPTSHSQKSHDLAPPPPRLAPPPPGQPPPPSPSTTQIDFLKQQLETLTKENARQSLEFTEKLKLITDENLKFSESFKTALSAIKDIIYIIGIFTGGAIGFLIYFTGNTFNEAKTSIKTAVISQVEGRMTAIADHQIDIVKRSLQREEVIGTTIVDYWLPTATASPNEFALLQGRAFQDIKFHRDSILPRRLTGDVFVLDLENSTNPSGQRFGQQPDTEREAFAKTQIDTVGPTLGRQILSSGLLALTLSFVGITTYLTFRFKLDYAILSIVALFHDVLITTGAFSLLGLVAGVEVDSLFVVSLLTITGFSVNDTVVIYDRIRETRQQNDEQNLGKSVNQIVDDAVNQTMGRSINTTLTVLFTLFSIYIFGGATLKNFALALIIGFTLGAYSSIFIASSLLGWWQSRETEAKPIIEVAD